VARLAVLRPDETGWAALQRMAERNVNQLPVLEDGVLLGAITREQLLTLVQAALDLGAEAASGSRGPLPGGGDAPAPIRP
jgi:CBS domain-containing protein